jgi:PAS domain-containing protein
MSLRAKIIAYLVLIHAVLAAISIFVLREDRLWLAAVEGLFVLSIILGIMLVRAFFVPLDLIRTGAELIGERDFTSQFREVGQPEMDALIRIYNQMIDRLREERLRLQEQHYFLEKILAASPAGIVTLDFDGRVSSLNPAAGALLQVSGDEARGRRWRRSRRVAPRCWRSRAAGGSRRPGRSSSTAASPAASCCWRSSPESCGPRRRPPTAS